MLPLIDRLLETFPSLHVLVTSGTVTSATLLDERLPRGAIHQYVPIDRHHYVRRFLDHWRPELAILTESEFWPNLVTITGDRRIPLILVNGRMSPESFAGWQKIQALCRVCCDASLSVWHRRIQCQPASRAWRASGRGAGNLKYATPHFRQHGGP